MDQRLIRYRSQGLSWGQIGKQMHLTIWSVRNRARILGLVNHKSPSAAKAAHEVGHPSNAGTRVVSSLSDFPPKTGRPGDGAASFEGAHS
jgi:hypothetical protein